MFKPFNLLFNVFCISLKKDPPLYVHPGQIWMDINSPYITANGIFQKYAAGEESSMLVNYKAYCTLWHAKVF